MQEPVFLPYRFLGPPEAIMASASFEELHGPSSLWAWNHVLYLDDAFSGLLCGYLQALVFLIPCSLLNRLYSHISLANTTICLLHLDPTMSNVGGFRPHHSSSLVMLRGGQSLC